MSTRRVVTGRDGQGKSVFTAVGMAPAQHDYVHIPGMSIVQLWATAANATIPHTFADPVASCKTIVPSVGGTQFMIVTFPPDAVMMSPSFDVAKAVDENMKAAPGLAERFEPDSPGMHTTDSVDYGIVLDGEISLELDNGQIQHLRKHDVVVQNGTRHAWRNGGSEVARVAFILVGARRVG